MRLLEHSTQSYPIRLGFLQYISVNCCLGHGKTVALPLIGHSQDTKERLCPRGKLGTVKDRMQKLLNINTCALGTFTKCLHWIDKMGNESQNIPRDVQILLHYFQRFFLILFGGNRMEWIFISMHISNIYGTICNDKPMIRKPQN